VGAAVKLAVGTKFQPMHGSAEAQLIEPQKHGFAFSVVGRLPKTGTAWDNAILVPIEAIWRIHTGALSGFHSQQTTNAQEVLGPPWSSEDIKGVPAIVVRVKSPADAYRLHALYQYRIGNAKTGTPSATMAVFPAEVLMELYAVIGDMRKVMAAMSLATQGIVLLAILLVITSVLAARRQSLAVLRAMGAPATFIFVLIWLQAFMIIGLGAALGLVFGWGGSMILVHIFASEAGFHITPTINFTEWLLATNVALAGSALAMIPSVIAWRQNIAKRLR
jgi:putative ABC transport system permease protein